MERDPQLDASRGAKSFCALAVPRRRNRNIFLSILLFLGLWCGVIANAQCLQTDTQDANFQAAYDRSDWRGVIQFAAPITQRSPTVNFEYGMALAHLQKWQDARSALLAGHRQCPLQERFISELAGIAYKQKRYPESAAWLRDALKINPDDAYANNFAGTVYFLLGNLDAALPYWNRVEKPEIAALRFNPQLRVRRLLLDRAFAFAPTQVMEQSEYETTKERLQGLGIFPEFTVALSALPDGKFDAELRAAEIDGLGHNRVQAMVSTLSGVAYESVYPRYFNLQGSAMNLDSLVRWDSEKRRIWVVLSAPIHALPQYRWQTYFDARSENWQIQHSESAPSSSSLAMSRQVAGVSMTSFQSGRWQWSLGGELSNRRFRNVSHGSALTPALIAPGVGLKQTASVQATVLNLSQYRLKMTSSASTEVARIWSEPSRLFGKAQGSAMLDWFPQAEGDRYEIRSQLRMGKVLGTAPFDEMFMLGMERDNDLWLRGHVGTRDGRKGSSPLGYSYVLSNTDLHRRVYGNGLIGIKAGPLFDMGRAGSPTSGLAPREWLFDAGASATLTVFKTSVLFTYGRDLRMGRNAFFVTIAK